MRSKLMRETKDTYLLDGNLLVALRIDTHEHHKRAHHWFSCLRATDRFATCSVTEGTLLRVHMAVAMDRSAKAAWRALEEIRSLKSHTFWLAGFSYHEVNYDKLIGGKQVTDAWLAEMARRKSGLLATLDSGLALLHPDVAAWVPEC